jgi:hypothetical protein
MDDQNTTDQTVVEPEQSTGEPPEQGQETTSQTTEGQQTEETQTRQERRQSRFIDKLSKQLEDGRSQSFDKKLNKSDYQPIQFGEQEYPISDLEKDRQQYGESQFERGVKK